MKRKRAFEKLESALVKRKFVRIVRVMDGADRLDGYVVAIGDDWVLLRGMDNDLSVDGWSAVRIRDIHSIDSLSRREHRDVQSRVLEALDQWPPKAPTVCLVNDLNGVIRTAQGVSALVAVHREASRPDSLWIGVTRAVDDENLTLTELDAAGEWDATNSVFDTDDVTRVDFDTNYIRNLTLVMGDVPAA
jgi:hypothetical protein